MEKKLRKKTFSKQLIFNRVLNSVEKVATFRDRDGGIGKVKTVQYGVIPGMRYNCKMNVGGLKNKKGDTLYNLVSYRIWIDDLYIVDTERTVQVLMENNRVKELDFGYGSSLDIESKTSLLRKYFSEKIFQLGSMLDIENFIGVYIEKCERVYKHEATLLKKESTMSGHRILL